MLANMLMLTSGMAVQMITNSETEWILIIVSGIPVRAIKMLKNSFAEDRPSGVGIAESEKAL